MNIGELFVTLGAKMDSSWIDGMNKLKGMGTVAKQAAFVAKTALNDFKLAARGAAAEANRSANMVIAAQRRQSNAIIRESARASAAMARDNARLMARRGINSPGVQAIRDLRSNLRGFISMDELMEDTPGSRGRRRVGWGELRNAMLQARLEANPNEGGGGFAMAPGGGRMRPFRAGQGGGMFGNGDPFDPDNGGGAAPPRVSGRRPGGGGGRRRRGGGGDFNRFGAIGELSTFRRVLYGAGLLQGVQAFGQLADVYLNLQNRLRGITGSQEEANATFSRLNQIATRTRSGVESTAEGYVRLRNATEGMNLSQDEQFKLIERINMALATSGATASEARSGMMQLTQALAKGKLDGDEFRSLAENMPNILKILQKSLGVTEGQLRDMSEEGRLTRDKIVKALLGSNGLEEAFDKTNATFGQTYELFKNRLIIAFGELAQNKDLVKSFAEVMDTLADVIVLLVKALGAVVDILGPFFKGLKDGKAWAIALATGIGLLATAWWSVARAATAAAAAQVAAGGSARGIGRAAGFFGAGSKFARGLGAASGAAMYATSQGNDTAGVLGRIGGATIAGGSLGGPIGALIGALIGTGIEAYNAPGMTPEQIAAASRVRDNGGGIFEAARAAASVTIGPITVNIYAQDGKDAKEQFDKEMMDRANRHAAAAFNRRGS